jgi:hypothetical protein
MAEIILNEPRVGALVGEREAASVAQHLRRGAKGQGGKLAPVSRMAWSDG